MFKKCFWSISAGSFLLGLFLAHYLPTTRLLGSFLCFILFLIFLFLNIKTKKIAFLILFFVFLAIWRYQLILFRDISGRIEGQLTKGGIKENFKIIGKIISEPEIKDGKQKIKLKIYYGQDEFFNIFKLKGKILLSTLAYPVYDYGDFLEVDGKYLLPGIIEGFDYGLYLKRFGITAVSYYPQIKKFDDCELNSIILKNYNTENNQYKGIFLNKIIFKVKRNIYIFKNKIADQFDFYLGVKSSAILRAMLLGDKSFLTVEMRESFSRSGLSHIIAISGLHISLLSSVFLNSLLVVGLSRKKSFYLSILFLLFYLILIGAPASACRASLMGFLSFLAIYMGRVGNLVNALFFTALLFSVINPLLVFGDIGFQLSFLAVLGIIYFHPTVSDFLQRRLFHFKFIRDFKKSETIIDIFSITISVQLVAGPVLISSFGQFSLIAPISNLLVLFLLPIIISVSLISIIVSFVVPFFGGFIFLFIDLLLNYIVLVSNLSNKIPLSFINISSWTVYFTIIYYLILIYIFGKNKLSSNFLNK